MSRQVVKIPRHNAKCNKYTVRPNFTSWTPASENEVGNYGSFRNLKDESLRLKSARREARFLLSWKICNSATGCSTSPFKLWALVMPGCKHFTQFLSQPDFVIIQTHTGEMQSTEAAELWRMHRGGSGAAWGEGPGRSSGCSFPVCDTLTLKPTAYSPSENYYRKSLHFSNCTEFNGRNVNIPIL